MMEIPQFFLPKSSTLSLINKKIAPPDKILLYGPKHNRILPQMPINTHKCSKSSHQSRGPSWRLQRHLPLKPPRRAVGDGSDDTDDGRSPRCRPTPRRWGDGAEEEAGEAGSGGPCHDCYRRKQELAKQHSDLALFCRNDLHEWPNFPIWQSTAVTLRDELTTSAAFNEIGANNRKML